MLKSWTPASSLDLRCLTLKTAMLLALATGKRCSSLAYLTLKQGFCEIGETKLRMQPHGLQKHSRPDYMGPPIVLEAYTSDPSLCPVFYVKSYIRRTETLRSSEQLFIITRAPHTPASGATLSSWLRKVIQQSGQLGSGGSVRSASTSRALGRGVTLDLVLNAGDWARVSTFKRFYLKSVPMSYLDGVLH